MEEDDYPNFGNAWNTATSAPAPPPAASWNPALRPDADHLQSHSHSKKASTSSVDDFFARYPAPTPEKSRMLPDQMPDDDEAEPASPIRPPFGDTSRDFDIAIPSAESSTDQPTIKTNLKEDTAAASHVPLGIQDEEPVHTGEEPAIFVPDDSVETQALELETQMPDSSILSSSTQGSGPQGTNSSEHRPGSGYEHQGELTELEAAVDEAPDAPLMKDPAAPSEVEEIALHISAPEPAQPSAKDSVSQIQRSFTTNFTDLPSSEQESEQESEEVEVPAKPNQNGWPAIGDDKTFGELLDSETTDPSASQNNALDTEPATDMWGTSGNDETFGELLGGQEGTQDTTTKHIHESEPKREQDVDAVWAAIGDDDLLDEDQELDPSKFFGDDDDGFLEDELLDPTPAAPVGQGTAQNRSAANAYTPANQYPTASPNANAYGSQYPRFPGQAHGRTAGTPQTGLYDLYNDPQQQQPKRPGLSSAQSFVDKSKGGYQSPYDLPMDVVRQPKQRPRAAPMATSVSPVPPPRSSSFTAQPQPVSRPPTATSTSSGGSTQGPRSIVANGGQVSKASTTADSGFFADLPVTSKPRSRPSGRYSPQPQTVPTPSPSSMPPQFPPKRPSQSISQPPSRPTAPPAPAYSQQPANVYGGLRQPDRLPLLPDQPPSTSPAPPQPPAKSRYSPNQQQAPSQQQSRFSPKPDGQTPAAASRYSPAPTSQTSQPRRQASMTHAFAPRTSSPLAYPSEKQQPQASLEEPRSVPSSPPKGNGMRSLSGLSSEPAESFKSPPDGSPPQSNMSPKRPKTQSPPTAMKVSRYSAQAPERPVSVAAVPTTHPNTLPHRRQFSRDIVYAVPTDERAQDPLERWKGQPIFKWGDSGSIITSFPKQTPFWTAGHGAPNVKCTPGEIKTQDASIFMPLEDRNAKFPGPLPARSKSKKKDVLSWMTGKIEDLEKQVEDVKLNFSFESATLTMVEEKLMLWKIVKIFVENDGSLESNTKVDEEVRAILLPNLAQMSQVADLQSPTSAAGATSHEQSEKTIVLQIRQALFEGQRERAVMLAEDKKLWGHAMLIASTIGADHWKSTVQNFVRSQVKSAGSDARSLAALYQVFAGNAEECADELVPPSARSGHQFIDMSGTKTDNPLVGLDQWRETLGLVAGNRTSSDALSLVALGKLLGQYGRAEAAHICFMFARQAAKHSGADDADADFVLLGSNHRNPGESFGNDLDSILLTEIYEWASSLSAPSSAVHYIPHLQSFKLIHAQQLAASGLKRQAQAYCDHITSAYSSSTRPSPYYHGSFTQAVSDLSAFLSQTPQTSQSGLLSKTKLWSSATKGFAKFVSGEDDSAASGTSSSAGGDQSTTGPFGGVSGDSPVISRAGSVADLYNPMMGGAIANGGFPGQHTPPQSFQSSSMPRYASANAAGGRYAPDANGGLGIDHQRPAFATAKTYAPAPYHGLGVPRPEASRAASDSGMPSSLNSRRESIHSQSSHESRPVQPDTSSAYGYTPPTANEAQFQPFGNGVSSEHHDGPDRNGFSADVAGDSYTSNASGYNPPTAGYEPPAYQPYQPEPEEGDSSGPHSKPKGFMEDDGDEGLAKRAAAMQKAEADRQADEAFRKAAEADAARDASKGGEKKGSWFGGVGGWFKKDPNAQQQQGGPIRAKLGEENSFVYDETLKKWVNKKAGAEAAAPAAATPPPPRGPIRATGAATGPPSGPSSAAGSGAPPVGAPGRVLPPSGLGSGPPSRAGTPAGVNGTATPPTALAPPSRPSTSMSNASSLDDLLGGPPGPGRKAGGTVKKGKKASRYVDVMGAK